MTKTTRTNKQQLTSAAQQHNTAHCRHLDWVMVARLANDKNDILH